MSKARIPNDNLFVCYYNVLTLIVHPLHEGLCKLHLSLIKLVVIKKLCTLLFLTFNYILIHLSLLKVQYHKNKNLSITIHQKCFEIKLWKPFKQEKTRKNTFFEFKYFQYKTKSKIKYNKRLYKNNTTKSTIKYKKQL